MVSAFCGTLVAAVGLAQSPRFLEPSGGGRLEPGSIVRVAWTFGGAEQEDFDEMELVLSLDGGRSFPLRLTREVSTTTESVLWRVPRLPSTHARLALRAGRGERPESETIRIVGGEFTILAGTNDPPEELRRVRGEWRTREAAGDASDLPEPSLSGRGPEEVRAGFPSERAAEPPESPASDPGRARWQAPPLAAAEPANACRPIPATRAALSLPLRQ
jgi:hypothetical protein